MPESTYDHFKKLLNSFTIPASIFSVKKGADGLCSEARLMVVNEIYKKSFLETFRGGENADNDILRPFFFLFTI